MVHISNSRHDAVIIGIDFRVKDGNEVMPLTIIDWDAVAKIIATLVFSAQKLPDIAIGINPSVEFEMPALSSGMDSPSHDSPNGT